AVREAAEAAPSRPVMVVTYREAANVFEILDNLSNWWSGKCDPEYRAYWVERFGVTPEDEQRFASYKAIRKRYYDYGPSAEPTPPKPEDVLFAPRKPPDRIAEAFYGAQTVAEALAALAAFTTVEDRTFLEQFYAAYRAQCQALLEESEAYATF